MNADQRWRPVAGYERGVSFQLATSASSPTFFAEMPARTPAWQGAHKPGGRPGPQAFRIRESTVRAAGQPRR
jgi:hypothetical protein